MRYAFAAVLLVGCFSGPNLLNPGNVTFKDLGPGPCEIGAQYVVDAGVMGYAALVRPLYTFDEKGRAATVGFRGIGQPPWELSYTSSEPCNVPPPILDEYEAPDSPSFVHGCPAQLTPAPNSNDALVKLTHDGLGHELSIELVTPTNAFKLSGEWAWGADGALTEHTGRIADLESWDVTYTRHDGGYRGAGFYTCQVPRCSQASTTFHEDLETDALGRITRLTREIPPVGTLGSVDVVYKYDCGPACSSDADCPQGPDWSCAPGSIWGRQCACTPTGPEVCDGHDNDCDGVIDEDSSDCSDFTGHVCTNGVCSCPGMCGGSCVDLKRDNSNCGQCNHGCPPGQVCNNSTCGCGQSSQQYCNGACRDVSSDPQNCGACGATCTGGTCSGSQCHCTTGMPCSGKCTDTTADSSNCGGCGVTCGTAEACVGSHCQCTGTLCGGACKDTANDKQNCGACGVACGGTCAYGHCIVTLASNQNDPRGIGVDSTYVYWTNQGAGTVVAMPLAGGSLGTLATNESSPYGLAVAGGRVYWADYTMNGKVMSGSYPVTFNAPVGSGAFPEEVVADTAGVYWTLTNSVQSNTPPTTVAGATNVQQLALDSAHVYFAAQNGVYAAPRDGGSVVTLGTGATPTAIAVNATTVFWFNAGNSTVMRAPLAGGLATTVASQQSNVSCLLADNAYLYWLAVDRIMEAPLDGGAPVRISPVGGTRMAMDATHLYWTSGLGTVSRTTKP